jgi:hypothetical protein
VLQFSCLHGYTNNDTKAPMMGRVVEVCDGSYLLCEEENEVSFTPGKTEIYLKSLINVQLSGGD